MYKKLAFLLKNILFWPHNRLTKNNISLKARLSGNTAVAKSSIGMQTYIACNAVIVNTENGNYCSMAPSVQIGGMEHSHWWLSTSTALSDQCSADKRTLIGNDVWIAAGSIIKQGVKIGDGAVIGAMSFVNKDVPENTIYHRVPAKFQRHRMKADTFERLKSTGYWDMDVAEAKLVLGQFGDN